MKLSGTVVALSEVPSLMTDLVVDDAESTTDSVIEAQSVSSDATSTRGSKSSHVSTSKLPTLNFMD